MFPLGFCKTSIIIIILTTAFSFPSSKRIGFAQAVSNDECVTPGGSRGICKNITECKSLLGLLIKSKSRPSARIIDYLWKSHCGYEGKNPIVCCPENGKPKESRVNVDLPKKTKSIERNFNGSCGSIQTLDKIIGGSATGLNEFPWMALIGYKTKNGLQYRCGGSLISPRYVLTAAHCVTSLKDVTPALVRLGEYDLGSSNDCGSGKECNGPAQNVGIEELIPHPEYFKPELRNDIALIRLAKKIQISGAILPICLPTKRDFRVRNLQDDKVIVTGWGATDSGMNSDTLQKVTLSIIPLSECSKVYKKKVPIRETQICAGGESGKDSCSGDSGGPLQIIDVNSAGEPVYVQHGIVSFGPRICGTKGIPGVYTKVSHYVEWIQDNMKNERSLERPLEKIFFV